jgi:putative PIN family toxin of toxin-antitoxin system
LWFQPCSYRLEPNRLYGWLRCAASFAYLSEPVFDEYGDVLHRSRLKLDPRKISVFLQNIRTVARLVRPSGKLSVSSDESDNRLLECAEAAKANYLVTGNIGHFPAIYKMTKGVTGRQFLDILANQPGR